MANAITRPIPEPAIDFAFPARLSATESLQSSLSSTILPKIYATMLIPTHTDIGIICNEKIPSKMKIETRQTNIAVPMILAMRAMVAKIMLVFVDVGVSFNSFMVVLFLMLIHSIFLSMYWICAHKGINYFSILQKFLHFSFSAH